MMQATASSSDYRYLLDIDITPLRVDFTIIIKDLKQHNVSFERQANSIGIAFSTFQRYMQGSQPPFTNGQAILILHTKVCGTRLTEKRFLEFLQQTDNSQ